MNAPESASTEDLHEATAEAKEDAEFVAKVRAMPKEIGVLLVLAGVGGLVLPGPIGTPFLVLGGVILWPKAFNRVESYLERRFPRMHHQSMRQIHRFIDDLDRRYPLPK